MYERMSKKLQAHVVANVNRLVKGSSSSTTVRVERVAKLKGGQLASRALRERGNVNGN